MAEYAKSVRCGGGCGLPLTELRTDHGPVVDPNVGMTAVTELVDPVAMTKHLDWCDQGHDQCLQ